MTPHWLFPSFRGWTTASLPSDAVAGMTVWAMLVPSALAYATIAGVSPVIGLYAVPAALLLYAVFGSSRQVITAPTSATAAVSAAAIAGIAAHNGSDFTALTVGLALTVGVIAILAGVARLGFVASFISEPVLKGFTIGLALTIMIGEVPALIGVKHATGDFFEILGSIIEDIPSIEPWTLAVGALSLIVIFGLQRISGRIPASLIVVILSIIAVPLFGLEQHGVHIVGEIPSGLPPVGLPDLETSDYSRLSVSAVEILLVGLAEALAAAKHFAAVNHYQVKPNSELIGFGAANVGSGLMGGLVVGGSLSRTAVNDSAGAKSQMSAVIAAVLTIVTLFFFTGLITNLPDATLAAIVIAALVKLVDFKGMRGLYRASTPLLRKIYGPVARVDFIAAIAATLGVLIFGTLAGLFTGIAASALLLMYRASRPHIAVLGQKDNMWVDLAHHPDAVPSDTLAVLRPEGALYYANADLIGAKVKAAASAPGITAVVIDAQTIPAVDVTAATMLAELAEDLHAKGILFLIARDIGQVQEILAATGVPELAHGLYPTVESAVDAIAVELNKSG